MHLRETLACLCHNQWSGWMKYLFGKGKFNDDGSWTMPPWAVKRWQQQMNISYDALTEDEKNNDRLEADKFVNIFDMKQGVRSESKGID